MKGNQFAALFWDNTYISVSPELYVIIIYILH